MKTCIEIPQILNASLKKTDSPTTATEDRPFLSIKMKSDRLSKSFSSASPNTALTPNFLIPGSPGKSLSRQLSFSSDTAESNALLDISQLLRNLTFFAGADSSAQFIQDISSTAKIRPFKPGDTVLRFGDVAKCMFLIIKGELSIMSEDNEIEYATLNAGSFVGEIGVLFNTVRTATVVSKTKSLLAAITSDDIESKMALYPDIKDLLIIKGRERLQAIQDLKAGAKKTQSIKDKFLSVSKPPVNTELSADITAISEGLFVPDDMSHIKSRIASRRSSINPETALDIANPSVSYPDSFSFKKRNSIIATDEEEDKNASLKVSFNASRRMSSIRFEVGSLAIQVNDSATSVQNPDLQSEEISIIVPDIKVENNEEKIPKTTLTLPSFVFEAPSLCSLENDLGSGENDQNVTQKQPEIENSKKTIVLEESTRRISIAVWSDPKLLQQAQRKDEGYTPIAPRKWDMETITSGQDADIDEEELNFLATSISFDEVAIPSSEEVLLYVIRYLSLKEIFCLRGLCKSIPDIIMEAKPKCAQNIDLSKNFRRLNDRGLIAIAKLFGPMIEKLNLHSGWQLSDRGIENIAKYSPNLVYLNLSEVWEISDSSLIAISRYCPELQHLDVSNCRKLSEKGLLCILESCTNLTVLSSSYCKNLGNTLLDHEAWTRLKSVNFHRCTGISDRAFEFWPLLVDVEEMWTQSRSIRQLALSNDWQLNSAQEDLEKSFGKLERFSSDDMKPFGTNSLTSIGSASVEQDSLQSSYSDKMIRDNSKGPVLILPESSSVQNSFGGKVFALRALDLRDCSFLSDSAIASIASVCSHLRVLNLSFCCSLSEDFARHLVKGCSKLSLLDVSFCGGAVTDEFLLEISTGLTRLKGLSVRGCVQVSDQGIEYIKEYAESLTRINCSQCKLISKPVLDSLSERFEVLETESVCSGIAEWEF